MIELFKQHMDDHGEQMQRYGYIGLLTAMVGLFVYWTLGELMGVEANVSNAISIIVAVVFGYVTNKTIVFRSSSKNYGSFLSELLRFIGSRGVTILMEIVLFAILAGLIGHDQLVIKGFVSFIVFITNYIISHYFVFQTGESRMKA